LNIGNLNKSYYFDNHIIWVYLHILSWQDESLTIPKLSRKVVDARLFKDKSPLKFQESNFGISVIIPKAQMNDIDTIVELELK
jgi:alpha-L-fucosidase